MKSLNHLAARSLATGGAALLAAALWSPAVSAQAQTTAAPQTFQVNLTQLNKSNASGTATVTINGNNVTVALKATGLSPNLVHAQHIHVGGQGNCAVNAADTDKDGFVSSKEAESAGGPIKISLTTSGDVAAGSALAVDRMPKADAQGNLSYNRTFALPSGVTAADMSRATIDQHGISSLFNDKAKYDGDKKSDLDNKLPFETTAIATCGKLTSTPVGAPNTGFGSTAGIESPALIAFGAAALAVATALVFYSRRPIGSRN